MVELYKTTEVVKTINNIAITGCIIRVIDRGVKPALGTNGAVNFDFDVWQNEAEVDVERPFKLKKADGSPLTSISNYELSATQATSLFSPQYYDAVASILKDCLGLQNDLTIIMG